MTDKEELCKLFSRNGIRYDEEMETGEEDVICVSESPAYNFPKECRVSCEVPCEAIQGKSWGCLHVEGYDGFYVRFHFNKEGKLEKVGIWE